MNFALKRRLFALLLHHANEPIRHICIEDWQERADDLPIWPD